MNTNEQKFLELDLNKGENEKGEKIATGIKKKVNNEKCTSSRSQNQQTSLPFILASPSNLIHSTPSHSHVSFSRHNAITGSLQRPCPHWCEHAGCRLSAKMSQMTARWEATGFWNTAVQCHCRCPSRY